LFRSIEKKPFVSTTGEGFLLLRMGFQAKESFFLVQQKQGKNYLWSVTVVDIFFFQKNKEVMGAREQEYEGKCV